MKKFEWRYVVHKDIDEVLVKWWKEWGFPIPPMECLPKTGVIVSDDAGDLYGGFLYLTDGAIAWMEWVVSDKGVSVDRKRGALEYMVDVFSELAKKKGMLLMFTSTSLSGYRNGLLRCGFLDGDSNTYQLIKGI